MKYLVIVFLLSFSHCFADTFTHRQSGKSFDGYPLQKKLGSKTRVRIANKSPQYLNLANYKIERNYLGRNNKIYVFSLNDSISLISVTEAFEKAIVRTSNQGPLFIVIEIDTPGGRVDLARRMCTAISKLDNCTTVAFISGKKYGGAFSTGAAVALACDRIYMRKGTYIGAASMKIRTELASNAIEDETSPAWLAYCGELAEQKGRPGLFVRAMAEADTEVIEVVENGKHIFIDPNEKKADQQAVRVWSSKDSLLTLTANDAQTAGIADEVVDSLNQLVADLDATKAEQKRDNAITKARRKFEREQRRLNRILSDISDLSEQADLLTEDVNSLEAEINRINEEYYRRFYGASTGLYLQGYAEVDVYLWRNMLIQRDQLQIQLFNVLGDLARNYRRALPIAQKHVDLSHYIETIEAGAEAVEKMYLKLPPWLRIGY